MAAIKSSGAAVMFGLLQLIFMHFFVRSLPSFILPAGRPTDDVIMPACLGSWSTDSTMDLGASGRDRICHTSDRDREYEEKARFLVVGVRVRGKCSTATVWPLASVLSSYQEGLVFRPHLAHVTDEEDRESECQCNLDPSYCL